MRREGHAALIDERKNANKILVCKHDGKKSFGRL
jgi:hypothetical protein